MLAANWTGYGSAKVMALQEIDQPQLSNKQILVKVACSSVTQADVRMRALNIPAAFKVPMRLAIGWSKPKNSVSGSCFAGSVVALGEGVTEFTQGDRVCGTTAMAFGAHADYLVIDAAKPVVKVPENVSDEQACALVFGGTTALDFLQHKIESGDQVLINGGSGAVGSFAVQLAKHYGAQVSAVAGSANQDLLKELGADQVFDYQQTSIKDHQQQYDLILDCAGVIRFAEAKSKLTDKGKFIQLDATLGQLLSALVQPKFICTMAQESKVLLAELLELVANKQLTPLIEQRFTLKEIQQAHEFIDTGASRGTVILTHN